MTRNLVLNASPIIILSRSNLIDLLPQLSEKVIIPSQVLFEINDGPDNDPARRWMMVPYSYVIYEQVELDQRILQWDLGIGETAVLSMVKQETNCIAVIDDLAARKCADAFGIHKIGTLGLLLKAFREGLIDNIEETLEILADSGMYISSELKSSVISTARKKQ